MIKIAISLMIASAFFNSLGAVFLKLSSFNKLSKIFKFITNKNFILAIFFYIVSTGIALPAYRLAEVSLIYPFISTSYIWTCLLSVRYLKENMNIMKWSGVGLIILGVTFIGIGS